MMHISREHFEIHGADGVFTVRDRESAGGTIVGDATIGGDRRGGLAYVENGDLIVVGSEKSPYIFRFAVSAD